jgi:hypothetical protein
MYKIAETYCTSGSKKAKTGERIAHFARQINLLLSQRIEKMTMADSREHASPLLFLTPGSEVVLEYKFHAPPLSRRDVGNRSRMTILEY